jgi:hypothetical protein
MDCDDMDEWVEIPGSRLGDEIVLADGTRKSPDECEWADLPNEPGYQVTTVHCREKGVFALVKRPKPTVN